MVIDNEHCSFSITYLKQGLSKLLDRLQSNKQFNNKALAFLEGGSPLSVRKNLG